MNHMCRQERTQDKFSPADHVDGCHYFILIKVLLGAIPLRTRHYCREGFLFIFQVSQHNDAGSRGNLSEAAYFCDAVGAGNMHIEPDDIRLNFSSLLPGLDIVLRCNNTSYYGL